MRKKIDDIFREKFRNVETTPPGEVWQNIAAALPEDQKKRRLLPVWFKTAGVAAVLALLFTLSPWNDNTSRAGDVQITLQPENSIFDVSTFSSYFNETMSSARALLQETVRETSIASSHGPVKKENVLSKKNIPTQFYSLTSLQAPSGSREGYSFMEHVDQHRNSNPTKEDIPEINEQDEPVQLLAAKDTEPQPEEKKSLSRRFSVTTTAAAVYFDNLGSGNALNNQFVDNKGSGEVSMAYGINIAYQVSEKVKVRTGVNKVNVSHNTNNVDFASATRANALEYSSVNIQSPSRGYLNQNLGFVEVPVEMEYAVLNKKFGISLIGGVSTLFLDENAVSLHSDFFSTSLGEANNLNNVSFTTNIGIGFNYDIAPQFRLNLEPIFKYQVNTFTNTSNFTPYIFGLYSGLSFKF